MLYQAFFSYHKSTTLQYDNVPNNIKKISRKLFEKVLFQNLMEKQLYNYITTNISFPQGALCFVSTQ